MNRKRNTKRNLFWGIFGKAIMVLGPFLTRTFLIYSLGAEYLGLSSLFTSILQVLNLAELGFSSAVAYCMYKPISDGDEETVCGLLAYFKRAYRMIGLAILAGGLAVAPFLGCLVVGDTMEDLNLHAAYLIYLANSVSSYFLFGYKQTLLNAYQRNDVVSKVSIVTMLVQYSLQVATLVLFPNFYVFAVVFLLMTIANNLTVAFVSVRMFPQYREKQIVAFRITEEERSDIRKRVYGLMVSKVCQVSRSSLDSIIISSMLGLTAVACYSNYLCILSALIGVMGVVSTSMTAAVGNSVASETIEKNYRDLRRFAFIYAMVSGVCAACLVSVYQPFMRIWVGEGLTLSLETAILFTTYFYVLTMGDMRSLYVSATGTWWELRWRSIAETVANIVLDIVFIWLWGINGAVLATIVSLFFVNFCYGSHLILKLYFKGVEAAEYYKDHFLYFAVVAVACVVSFLLSNCIPGDGLLPLLAKGVVSFLASTFVLLCAFCRTARFSDALSFLKRR